ncbi:hypothetical protein JQ633_33110 [Bradyrhizobium tropiciagri]|uniref:hypothetical protein n=1 Tax=Bradyrhizobium tropiciagri TaxID=312253 RepID=UPI001BADF27A|nr:hypothetical protein [Bradyrhizobium tropiciagri]MBR0875240.1 hypothetical protein [Bradyrhizobium tropiciagri]
MAVAITHDHQGLRVEWLKEWWFRLASLPFLAGGAYFAYYVGLMLAGDLVGSRYWSEDWVPLLAFTCFALVVGVPGLILATLRYFIDVDPLSRRLVVTKKFGPLEFHSRRELSEFKFISITDDSDADTGFTMYDVNLCGGRGTKPIQVSSFAKREEANAFAATLGAELKLRPKDYVGTEPDAD